MRCGHMAPSHDQVEVSFAPYMYPAQTIGQKYIVSKCDVSYLRSYLSVEVIATSETMILAMSFLSLHKSFAIRHLSVISRTGLL